MGYQKAIVTFLGGLVTLLAEFIPGIEKILTAEFIQAIGVLVTTILVIRIPNRGKTDA